MNKTVGIYTLGCRVNQYESDALSAAFSRAGFIVKSISEACDVYVVNTCTVTAEADRKARNIIARAHRKNENSIIIVCGCYAQTSAEICAGLDGVKYVCGTRNKLSSLQKAIDYLKNPNAPTLINVSENASLPFEKMEGVHTDRTRAFIKIEDGCPNNCTYCIIKSARGPVVSRTIDDVIHECEILVDKGFTEIVFSGIETASFGRDTGENLPELIEKASKIEGLRRIRTGSMDPAYLRPEITEKLLNIEKFMPHIHLSLQSGADRILALMKRGYNSSICRRNIEYMLKIKPEMKFSSDFIVGFPTETDEDFKDSMALIRDYPFIHSHIFKYSKRAGTEASVMTGQIPSDIKTERSYFMSKLQDEKNIERAKEMISQKTVHELLFENCDKDYIYAHSRDFTQFKVEISTNCKFGDYGQVQVTGYENGVFIGTLI